MYELREYVQPVGLSSSNRSQWWLLLSKKCEWHSFWLILWSEGCQNKPYHNKVETPHAAFIEQRDVSYTEKSFMETRRTTDLLETITKEKLPFLKMFWKDQYLLGINSWKFAVISDSLLVNMSFTFQIVMFQTLRVWIEVDTGALDLMAWDILLLGEYHVFLYLTIGIWGQRRILVVALTFGTWASENTTFN